VASQIKENFNVLLVLLLSVNDFGKSLSDKFFVRSVSVSDTEAGLKDVFESRIISP
jgi:hypothetical protein